ncbi:E3 ubiquitin-protein ligase listerin [Ceratobasidium sp. AG-Ba]|nr:E3 ubiquitin-protein ligase listerin [Ceratobasidium sp. AG-Ba]
MGKQGKSSATSATRKKHQRKNAPDPSISIAPQAKSQGKGKGKKSKEPRVKQYIPPPKFKPLVEDPIEQLATTGLLPPHMVLAFKGLSKRDPVTKTKALEDLNSMLDDECWPVALPVWFILIVVRLDLRDELQSFVSSHADAGTMISAWVLGANDIVPSVAASLKSCWDSVVHWRLDISRDVLLDIQERLEELVSSVLQAVVEPDSVYRRFAPLAAPTKDSTDKSEAANAHEQPHDRDARLRTSGLGAIRSILEEQSSAGLSELLPLIHSLLSFNPSFGGILSSRELPSFLSSSSGDDSHPSPPFGYGQRNVRIAGWNVVHAIVKHLRSERILQTGDPLKPVFLSSLGIAALQSAWVEPDPGVRKSMWEALLPLITAFPEVWTALPLSAQTTLGQEDDSTSEDEDEDGPAKPVFGKLASLPGHAAYLDFLNFLQLGCLGSGIQSYPAVCIVLSTIPPAILPYNQNDLARLFNSFWAAYDGNALSVLSRDKEPLLQAFLSASLESALLLCRRLKRTEEASAESLSQNYLLDVTAGTWIGRVITESVKGALLDNLSFKIVGALFGGSIKNLENLDAAATERAWIHTWKPAFIDRQNHPSETINSVKLLASALGQVHGSSINELHIKELLSFIMSSRLSTNTGSTIFAQQAQVVRVLWESVESDDTWLSQETAVSIERGLVQYLISTESNVELSSLLGGFMNSSAPEGLRKATWNDFLTLAARSSPHTLQEVLNTVKRFAPVLVQNLDFIATCKSWVTEIGEGNDRHLVVLMSVLRNWEICLDRSQLYELVNTLVTAFIQETENLIFAADFTSVTPAFPSLTEISLAILQHLDIQVFESTTLSSGRMGATLRVISALSTHLPVDLPAQLSRFDSGQKYWWNLASLEVQSEAKTRGQALIARLLSNCASPLSVLDVLDTAQRSGFYANEEEIVAHALPPGVVYEAELRDLADNPSPLLAEFDPLVPVLDGNPTSSALSKFDSQGLAKYPRITIALSSVLSQNRHLAKQQLWSLPYLLALQQLCSDFVLAPSWPTDAFRYDSLGQVRNILTAVSQLVVYLENSLFNDVGLEWHQKLIARLDMIPEDVGNPIDASQVVCLFYYRAIRSSGSLQDVRLLRRVVQAVLRDADSDILDIWAGFAQHLLSAIALGSIVASRGLESARLDRWRNELASRIAGIPLSSANSVGIPLLRTLNAIAPPTESGVSFLPQQRAVYLMQALQKWMASDEELDECLETHATVTIYHALPILQTIPGAHWEFMLDILEGNIAVEGDNSVKLYVLLQTLRAIQTIQDLAALNKGLLEIWKPRAEGVFEQILALFLSTKGGYHKCLVACLRAFLPLKINQGLFDQFLSLILNQDIAIKAMAHELARNALAQMTEQRVLEAAVMTSSVEENTGKPKDFQQPELPPLLTAQLAPILTQNSHENQVNLLLSWWIALEFFDGSSLGIKQGYLDQLRRLDLVRLSLLPCLFELLGIGITGEKPLGLSQWYVEEYYFDLYDDSLPSSMNVMAAHIYYKALRSIPGLIRSWWSECQDKQLASSLAAYTKANFSPVIIKQELSQFRSLAASATESLNDDTFSVKVAPSVNEISAVYSVDDQTLEIAIRLPPEFPLRAAEVRDVRGISGMENRKRAWVFGVQQTAQQGLIYDALSVYKKNVTFLLKSPALENPAPHRITDSSASPTGLSLLSRAGRVRTDSTPVVFTRLVTTHSSNGPSNPYL